MKMEFSEEGELKVKFTKEEKEYAETILAQELIKLLSKENVLDVENEKINNK